MWMFFVPATLPLNSQSVQSLVVSDSVAHGLQLTRPPCPSPTPRIYSNSCLSSRWCHPAISSSVVPFSSHLQSFPASGSFQMSQFFASSGQSIGVSASASVLPMKFQDWFPLSHPSHSPRVFAQVCISQTSLGRTNLSATCWSRSLEGGSSLVLLASEDLVILRGLSIPHNHAGLVLFIAAWWNTLQSLNFSVVWSKSQS